LIQIAAWRSRGSLPIPVDVTAAFVEIRLRDPFFRYDVCTEFEPVPSCGVWMVLYMPKLFVLSTRNGLAGDDALESEVMLAMLYSMAIMR
jgi:ribosomal biogenesis protein LAS1